MKRALVCVMTGSLLGAVSSAQVDYRLRANTGSRQRAPIAAMQAEIPPIREKLPALWLFLENLYAEVEAGRIRSQHLSTQPLSRRC